MNRKGFLEMWDHVKVIEDAFRAGHPPPLTVHRDRVWLAIVELKKKIQSVVGQLE